jgi:hypothetical protein
MACVCCGGGGNVCGTSCTVPTTVTLTISNIRHRPYFYEYSAPNDSTCDALIASLYSGSYVLRRNPIDYPETDGVLKWFYVSESLNFGFYWRCVSTLSGWTAWFDGSACLGTSCGSQIYIGSFLGLTPSISDACPSPGGGLAAPSFSADTATSGYGGGLTVHHWYSPDNCGTSSQVFTTRLYDCNASVS